MGKTSKSISKEKVSALVKDLFQACVLCSSKGGNMSPKEAWKNHLLIRDKVTAIKSLQNSIVERIQSQPREERIKELFLQMERQGVDISAVESFCLDGDSFGLRAKHDIVNGDSFLDIPYDYMITKTTVANSGVGMIVQQDPLLSEMPNVALAFFLLHEIHNPNSKLSAYINSFPLVYDNILHFEVADFEVLRGTALFTSALNIWLSITRQYAYLHNLVLNHPVLKMQQMAKLFSYSDYIWAVSVVMTRQNMVTCHGKLPSLALIPLLDMCNHHHNAASLQFDSESSVCSCVSNKDVLEGAEIHIYYGARTNTEFVIHNGFFYDHNESDCLMLNFTMNRNDALFPMRKSLLTTIGLQCMDQFALTHGENPVTPELLIYLAVQTATEEELTALETKLKHSDCSNIQGLVSEDNLHRAYKGLLVRCDISLRCYPTSLIDDQKQLSTPSLTECRKLALKLVINEKNILNHTIDYLKSILSSA